MKYEIIYDYSDEYTDERDLREIVECEWGELLDILASMRKQGCYHIAANAISGHEDF